ncbi:hypothetical protein EDB92DRAFT_1955350 [Lactarius akahatsu]|uniref:Uncharacterized protein n=1 Tax=Lactarius akahatsu TaxID=416441 RepID=A0AAD4L3Z5_9AGAM|nr:hypothetical protein EDB92DRAFT_1955350 [Lactarius akahatsu]
MHPPSAARPRAQACSAIKEPYARRPTYRFSTVRFTRSDIKLWSELDRIPQFNADPNGAPRAHRASSPV